MNVAVTPRRILSGEITAPPSKARTHRAVFGGLLSSGVTTINNALTCDDTTATANAATSLGAKLQLGQGHWSVESSGRLTAPHGKIECGESGVTLRFTIPISSLMGGDVWLSGSETLMRRPLQPLIETMQQLGREITLNRNKVHVKAGPAKGGSVQLPGDVSSQFISGLLLASPLMEDGLRMKLISRLESRGYVSMTIAMMKRHGVEVEVNDDMSFFQVLPRQAYKPTEHVIPGDYSSAAFPIAAAAVTESNVQVRGLEQNGSDPDSAILEILSKMGAATTFSSDALLVKGRALKAVNVNISDCPDLGPVIAVLGCCAEGETRITGAERLRYKESDRVSAITSQLRVLGAEVEDTGSGFLVSGPSTLHGGVVNSYGDHRIAMALSIAALNASEQVVIREAQCVTKSYPSFFDDIRSLGVEAVER